jgi:hypothetical protein
MQSHENVSILLPVFDKTMDRYEDTLTFLGMKQTMRILLPLASEYLARHLLKIFSDDQSGEQSWPSLAIATSSCSTDV